MVLALQELAPRLLLERQSLAQEASQKAHPRVQGEALRSQCSCCLLVFFIVLLRGAKTQHGPFLLGCHLRPARGVLARIFRVVHHRGDPVLCDSSELAPVAACAVLDSQKLWPGLRRVPLPGRWRPRPSSGVGAERESRTALQVPAWGREIKPGNPGFLCFCLLYTLRAPRNVPGLVSCSRFSSTVLSRYSC